MCGIVIDINRKQENAMSILMDIEDEERRHYGMLIQVAACAEHLTVSPYIFIERLEII